MNCPASPRPDPDAEKTFARVITHADKLFEALEDLEAAGGLKALARHLRPATLDRIAAVLRSTRRAIDGQLQQVKGIRRQN